eukprot:3587696-Amphidinium_carterae.1
MACWTTSLSHNGFKDSSTLKHTHVPCLNCASWYSKHGPLEVSQAQCSLHNKLVEQQTLLADKAA